jgi:hypothetical protein
MQGEGVSRHHDRLAIDLQFATRYSALRCDTAKIARMAQAIAIC